MDCLDENQLVAFVANALAPIERKAVEDELDRCESCRLLLCDWARMSIASEFGELAKGTDGSQPKGESNTSLRVGSHIDRFEIIDYLGAGGMGVVFRSHDPKLDREIALKLLRPHFRQNSAATQRLLQEAKTMAKLKHPNVLTIYDSGEEGELLYLAMELAPGGTLAEWIKQKQPSWQEIATIFADAASGLAAAHRENIVHRDVKPGNLLMDSRGVVRVSDFGLASEATDLARNSPSTIVGTIGYMAPEVLAGQQAREPSDQYSLCVSLFEALIGQKPFPGQTPEKYKSSLQAKPLDLSGIPKRLRPLLRRGLKKQPMERYESMHELEQALRSAARSRMLRIYALLATLLVGASLLAVVLISSSEETRKQCPRATKTVTEFWNAERAANIENVFAASKRSHALATWTASTIAINAYTEDWLDNQQSTCRATRISGEQSEALLDARTRCLQQQLRGLQSVLNTFDTADANIVDKSVALVDSLAEAESCSADRVLTWQSTEKRLPSDNERRTALQVQLAESNSLYVLGDYVGAEALSRKILSQSSAEQDIDLIAKAGANLGQALLKQQQPETATKALLEASNAAATIGDHELAAQIWIGMAIADGYYLDKVDAGMAYLRAAKSAIANVGELPLVEIRILQIQGLLQSSVDPVESLKLQQKALAMLRSLPGDHSKRIGDSLNLIGLTHRNSGDLANAESVLAEAKEVAIQSLGKDHPDLFQILIGLGKNLREQGKYDEAWSVLEEGRTLLKRSVGTETRDYADALTNLALVRLDKGEFEIANKLMDESIAIRKKSYGTDIRGLAEALVNLAAINFNTGNFTKAQGLYEESLVLMTQALGPVHLDLAIVHEGLGLIAVTNKKLDEGLRHYSLAQEILKSAKNQELRLSHLLVNVGYLQAEQGEFLESESSFLRAQILLEGKLGANHVQSAPILTGLGEANYQLKRYDKAKSYLLSSVKIQSEAKSMPHVLATTQLLLAYTLWDSKQDRPEALRLAREAKTVFEKYKHGLLTEVTGWISAREQE